MNIYIYNIYIVSIYVCLRNVCALSKLGSKVIK